VFVAYLEHVCKSYLALVSIKGFVNIARISTVTTPDIQKNHQNRIMEQPC
jgi:hypothetical protein